MVQLDVSVWRGGVAGVLAKLGGPASLEVAEALWRFATWHAPASGSLVAHRVGRWLL